MEVGFRDRGDDPASCSALSASDKVDGEDALEKLPPRAARMATPALRPPARKRALVAYALSVVALALGVALAAARFPGGYDWQYQVLSALASRKHNPEGAAFFSIGLAASLALLWPALGWSLGASPAGSRLARVGLAALRAGIVLGVLVALERLAFQHLSSLVRKGHVALALLCFASVYAGVLALQLDRLRRRAGSPLPALATVAPLVAVAASQLALWLDQRDLGWVGRDWRELGVAVWLSFAFWQWLAALMLWASVGQLVATARVERAVDHRRGAAPPRCSTAPRSPRRGGRGWREVFSRERGAAAREVEERAGA
jgi:hypothetical protein